MQPTAVVYFDDAIFREVSKDPTFTFGREYFQAPEFSAKPNSTHRLNIVNFTALRKLAELYPIELFHHSQVRKGHLELSRFGQVVVNSVASFRTIEMAKLLIEATSRLDHAPDIIFGTEYSWHNRLVSGEVEQTLMDAVHKDHMLLRHTPRTDRALYEGPEYRNARIQEFELAVDSTIMPDPHPIRERRTILFVVAPHGRPTKNNDEIWRIRDELAEEGLEDRFSIEILEPPYTTAQYWDILRSTQFLIFTSRGETFSYVMHDAMAMGAIVLRRPEVFSLSTSKFGVDSYCDSGLRYTDAASVVETINAITADPQLLELESERSKTVIERQFSQAAVESNWIRLLSGSSLNVESLYIGDLARGEDGLRLALNLASSLDCRFVMAYMCRGLENSGMTSYSSPSASARQCIIPFCYISQAGKLRHVRRNLGLGPIADEMSADTIIEYLRIVVRTHKIRNIYVEAAIASDALRVALQSVDYLEGKELVPVKVQFV